MRLNLLFFLTIVSITSSENTDDKPADHRKWRLIPFARGIRTAKAKVQTTEMEPTEFFPSSEQRWVQPRAVEVHDLEKTAVKPAERFRPVRPERRRRKKNSRKERRIESTPEEEKISWPPVTTPKSRIQSKRKHFVIVAPSAPDPTPEPILPLINTTTIPKGPPLTQHSPTFLSTVLPRMERLAFGAPTRAVDEPAEVAELDALLRDLPDAQEGAGQEKREVGGDEAFRVNTEDGGSTALEISPEQLPEEYRKMLRKGYVSYPTFNAGNYSRKPQALFEASILPPPQLQFQQPQNQPQQQPMFMPQIQQPQFGGFGQPQLAIGQPQLPSNFQLPDPRLISQNGFTIPQNTPQNQNQALLLRARQMLALRDLELQRARQMLLLQQTRQAQAQAQFMSGQQRVGREIASEPAPGQISPLLMAEIYRRQIFVAQLMAQAQQRAALAQQQLPDGWSSVGNQGFTVPQNNPFLQSQDFSGGWPEQQPQIPTGPTASITRNGQQFHIPVVFKRGAPLQ
ncbi:unnamed protein product, partial [Mesorhabditis spiculigera]